jgi:hypothetical protein
MVRFEARRSRELGRQCKNLHLLMAKLLFKQNAKLLFNKRWLSSKAGAWRAHRVACPRLKIPLQKTPISIW